MPDLEQDADSQDLAEAFDETNTTRDGYGIAHPDTDPDVYNVTTAEDDADEDEPPIRRRARTDKLDADLGRSFPASDPLPVDPGAD